MDTQVLLNRLLCDYNEYYHDKQPELTSRERTKSFIYKYFLDEKKREAAKFTERKTDFFKGLAALVKGTKIDTASDILRISEKGVKIRDNYLLLAISRKAFEYGWISENELKAVVMKTRKLKKVPPVLFQRDSAEYNAEWERALRILLQKTICDFFNSKGLIVNGAKNSAAEFSTKKRSRDDRKERDLVHLYHRYINFCEQKKQPKSARQRYSQKPPAAAEEYKERAKRLLRAITDDRDNAKRYRSDIVPVYFDARTGAGIYLIGVDCFEPEVLEKSDFVRDSVCVPCIVSFYSGMLDNLYRFVHLRRLENGSKPIKAEFEMDVEMFATLDKAFEAFARKLKRNEFDESFSLCNMSPCPLPNDDDFRRFFG